MNLRPNLVRLASIAVVILAAFIGVKSLTGKTADLVSTEPSGPVLTHLQSDMTFISHAGAGLPAGAYSNSLQALELGLAKTPDYIEIDFSWTADGKLVLLHDWHLELDAWFDLPLTYNIKRKFAGGYLPMTEAEFLALNMRSDLTQMNLDDLMTWLKGHPELQIMTDIKSENIAALTMIATEYPEMVDQLVPQIYSFEQFDQARDLGYRDIVFTGYRSPATIPEIIDFASTHDVLAITLPQGRLTVAGLAEFEKVETPIWTHTVNSPITAGWLQRAGVDGVYTDFMTPFPE